MRKTRTIAIAALLAAGTAMPALAEWNHIGDLEASPDHYSNVQLGGFTGRVEQIRINAAGRADCDDVRVTYENGDTQDVFSGTIPGGQDQLITFPDQSRRVEAVSLNCRAEREDGAHIAVSADIPAFRATDDHPPPHTSSYTPARDLVLLASRDFGDLDQRTLMLNSSEPRAIDEIALQPVGADARCRNVRALFDDGTTSRTVPNDGDDLQEGHIYSAFVGGGDRDLNGIDLTCEAANGDHVQIKVYAVG
jgi:hypothetical protein